MGLPWNPLILRCPFDCDEFEENLNNEEEAIISARPQPWAEHMLQRVRTFEHVQWLCRVTARCRLCGRSRMQCSCPDLG